MSSRKRKILTLEFSVRVTDVHSVPVPIQSVSQPPYLRGRGQLLFFTFGRYSSQMGAAAYGYLVVGKAFNRDSSRMKRY